MPEPFSWIGAGEPGEEIAVAADRVEIDSKHWRCREAETRLIALSIRDPDAKQVLLAIADGYRRLAEREACKADKLFDGVSFGPDALRAVGAAFEAAWRDIADNYGIPRNRGGSAKVSSGGPLDCFRRQSKC
jgi:hypothetical protein